ncbi:hypothetical protein SCLCIDRAFT_994817 [Scleroderma citrinum Foug A]|uniref:Uncharacterized protein n=1 Tax=Scleroderma citrinum Foug A TaxID=1036808 RepID=A0A0C3A4D0_9AGAM|nr:hypothetical protein SCLCIDRAFT_994817 [Scleroderma citrinum Foug A]
MLDAFKIKEFDLNPVFAAWENPPRFYGNPKRDMPVDEWLEQIKAGCVERKVPEECWHKVAQHYLGDKAKARLVELKNVMAQMNGGKYRWSWKKFKIAMKNMGWEIDAQATTPVEVPRRLPAWLTRRRSNKSTSSLSSDSSGEMVELATADAPVPPPKDPRPSAVKMLSDTAVNAATAAFKHRAPQRANTMAGGLMTASAGVSAAPAVHALAHAPGAVVPGSVPGDANGVTTISNVPTWLLNACQALNFLTAEHPKAMTTLSAVLITAGTLPAIPALSGGTVLATGVAQAVGAIARAPCKGNCRDRRRHLVH